MKRYAVKDTIIKLTTLETHVYYTGKDGYVHDDTDYLDGYTKPHFAQAKIEREIDGHFIKRIDNNNALESGVWLHHFEVVEYEERK